MPHKILYYIIHSWKACISFGPLKVRKIVDWCLPLVGWLQSNVDGVAREKSKPTGITGVFRNTCYVILSIGEEDC